MRREYEWVDYLKSIDAIKSNEPYGKAPSVSAREAWSWCKTPELQTRLLKKTLPIKFPMPCHWPARGVLEYSPIDVVHKFHRGALFIAVEGDAVTPEQQSLIYTKKPANLRNWFCIRKLPTRLYKRLLRRFVAANVR